MSVPFEEIEKQPLSQFSERAYLDYSMYVILDRALPRIGDGLKPVQRRIVYAMSELGLSATAKPKKSARTVGDVLGKFHPHGDTACYEAMVLMAQPFSYRYPLIEGQGNWGSQDDPKSFAAMRYTEARLTAYARLLLAELQQGTVDWQPNFDGTLQEPQVLPARLPNVLLNGASGIAVGMSTDIPPHNLGEVAAACLRLLEVPDSTLEQLCALLPGPDFPTGGEVVNSRRDIQRIYASGTGSLRLRARWGRENGDLVITELPYQVSSARVMEQIGAQMQARKLAMVADLRDESDEENPVRLVLEPRSNRVDLERLMDHLFASTDLERSVRVNLNMIGPDGRPRVKNLRDILQEWLEFRRETVRRRLRHRLDRVLERLHLLDGLLIAFLNLDEVIRIIRSEDHPKPALIERFRLSEAQADFILETRLRQLARLEEMRIRAEQQELAGERDRIRGILGDAERLRDLIAGELRKDAESFGDPRRTALVERGPARALDETELSPSEPVTVVLSRKGWVRAARGHEVDGASLNYRGDDAFLCSVPGRSNQSAVFLDSAGRSYALPAHSLASARGYGEPLTGRLSPPAGCEFVGVLMGPASGRVLLASTAGYGFVASLEDMLSRNKAGKAMLSVPEGARALAPRLLPSDPPELLLAAVSRLGHLLIFPLAELPEMARGKGSRIIGLGKGEDDALLHLGCLTAAQRLTVHSGRRHFTLKRADLESYQGTRGRRGRLLPRGLRQVEALQVSD